MIKELFILALSSHAFELSSALAEEDWTTGGNGWTQSGKRNWMLLDDYAVDVASRTMITPDACTCRKACMVSGWCYASSYASDDSVCSMTDSLSDGVPMQGRKYYYWMGRGTNCKANTNMNTYSQLQARGMSSLKNAALNKIDRASSFYNEATYPASYATDGDISIERHCYISANEHLPFIVIDLGVSHVIWGIRIMPRMFGWWSDRFINISIRTGTTPLDGPDFSSYTEIAFIPGPPTNPVTIIEHFMTVPVCGRYVVVQRVHENSNYMEITEIEVLVK